MLRLCKLTAAMLLAASCGIISFDELDISTNLPEHNLYFADKGVELHFSLSPDKKSAESMVSLQCENQTVPVSYSWSGNSLFVKEDPEWQKGRQYKISLNGSLLMENGTHYTADFLRYFYYGEAGNLIEIVHVPPAGTVQKNDPLVFEFSKAVNIVSFQNNFTMSPYRAVTMLFSGDRKRVTIKPVDGWQTNQNYQWSVSTMLSDDGYCLARQYSGFFSAARDDALPRVVSVCLVTISPDVPIFYRKNESIDGILDNKPIGIVFSKPMDKYSVEPAFSFEPSLNGYALQDTNDGKCFVFYPAEPYAIGERYKLTVPSSVKDTNGLSPSDAYTVFFTSKNAFLTLKTMTLDTGTVLEDFSDADKVHEHEAKRKNSANEYQIEIALTLSTAIETDFRIRALDAIRVTPVFPSTIASPYLISARWEPSGAKLTMLWEHFTPGTANSDSYYMVKITGGKSGLQNGRGEYPKEDICVLLRVK